MERANRSLETFTYSVAHDLRAPLRALGGYSAALIEDCGDGLGEAGRGYAERIEAASEQMSVLIDDLLDLSRVARAEMHLQEVDLGAEAARIAGDLQREGPGRRVQFAIQRPVRALADRSLIRSVLENLVGNAWKFTSRRDDALHRVRHRAGRGRRPVLLRAGQRRRLRPRLHGQIVPALPAAASGR